MNVLRATVFTTIIAGVLSAILVPLDGWPGSAKSIITVLAIFAAAILVRLNRGIPTIDWSKVDSEKRKNLVEQIRDLSISYGITLGCISFVLLAFLISERAEIPLWAGFQFEDIPAYLRQIGSGLAGASVGFIGARMAYVVWKDIDIVDLQAEVVVIAAKAETKAAREQKAKDVKEAGVRDPRKS